MLAVALAVAACQAGFSISFTTLDDLVRDSAPPKPPAGSTDNSKRSYGPPS